MNEGYIKIGRVPQPYLKGRVALVTGAGRGIGRAIAVALAKGDAFVFVCSRTEEHVRRTVAQIQRFNGKAEGITADISSEKDVKAAFQKIRDTEGRLDILVNNAGVGYFGPVEQCRVEDFDEMMAVNVRGTFLCCREALALMTGKRGGAIINISSVVGIKGYPQQAGYTASKHAVVGLAKSLAAELRSRNIRVSVILPGGVDTDMVRRSRPDLDPKVLLKPSDVAQAVLFLLSLSPRAWVDSIYIRRRASPPF